MGTDPIKTGEPGLTRSQGARDIGSEQSHYVDH